MSRKLDLKTVQNMIDTAIAGPPHSRFQQLQSLGKSTREVAPVARFLAGDAGWSVVKEALPASASWLMHQIRERLFWSTLVHSSTFHSWDEIARFARLAQSSATLPLGNGDEDWIQLLRVFSGRSSIPFFANAWVASGALERMRDGSEPPHFSRDDRGCGGRVSYQTIQGCFYALKVRPASFEIADPVAFIEHATRWELALGGHLSINNDSDLRLREVLSYDFSKAPQTDIERLARIRPEAATALGRLRVPFPADVDSQWLRRCWSYGYVEAVGRSFSVRSNDELVQLWKQLEGSAVERIAIEIRFRATTVEDPSNPFAEPTWIFAARCGVKGRPQYPAFEVLDAHARAALALA